MHPSPDQETLQPAESNNGLVGVASIASIASRNSRVSSLGGIQIYPGLDAPITVSNTDGEGYFYPLTVTKEADGKYASGSIQLLPGYPGSVVVSSTARSGYGPELKLPININKPLLKEFIIPIPELFDKARAPDPVEPWFLKNLLPISQPRFDVDNAWFYPNFNPFMNFWR